MAALTFHSGLNINQLHFINPMPVTPLFQQSIKYSSQSILVHSVARLVVGRHFDTKCICSDPHMPCSVLPRPRRTLDRLDSVSSKVSMSTSKERASQHQPYFERRRRSCRGVVYTASWAYREIAC